MSALELWIILGVVVLACGALAQRTGIATPVLLLACGASLGFAPQLREAGLPSRLMLLLFVPALLYWESLNASLREIRANLLAIVPLSTVFVAVVAGVVAVVAHALGLPWAPAWALGGAVAPTDATALAALARALPRQLVTIIHAESLLNDGTALVIYAVAVDVTVTGAQPSLPQMVDRFVLSYAGGLAVGLFTAWATLRIRRLLDAPLLENTVSLLTPFSAFFLADVVHTSGPLAAVICGLTLSKFGPKAIRADTRQQSFAFWRLATFVLNNVLFVLVGLQMHATARSTADVLRPAAYTTAAVIPVVIIAVRFAWLFTVPHLVRRLAKPTEPTSMLGPRHRAIIATAGFRGAVSIAAALAIPEHLASGAPFPYRDRIILVTGAVVVVTVVAQGLALPRVVAWARLPADTKIDEELRLADVAMTADALAEMDTIAAERGIAHNAVDLMRAEYDRHLAALHAHRGEDDDPDRRATADIASLRLGLIAHKRATAIALRDARHIDDIVLRQIQANLDVEEIRLSRRDLPE